MGYSSKWFSRSELECHGNGCCDGLPPGGVDDRLLEMLDSIRERIGGPLEVSCVYRCPIHNAEVGGVPGSTHEKAIAADILQPDYMPDFGTFKWHIYNNGVIDPDEMGIGEYASSGFIHTDLRGYAARWTEDDY